MEQDGITTLTPREGREVLALQRVPYGQLSSQLFTKLVQVVWYPPAEVIELFCKLGYSALDLLLREAALVLPAEPDTIAVRGGDKMTCGHNRPDDHFRGAWMNEMILTDADLMDAAHWPVTVTFGLYDGRDPNCAGVARDASEGAGYSFNDKGLSFWDELDEYDQAHEEPFEVECFVVHDSCRLTYGEFYHYMELACGRYAERHPERASELEDDLEKYAARFLRQGSVLALGE